MLLGKCDAYTYRQRGGKRVVEGHARQGHSTPTPRNIDIMTALDPEEEHLVFKGYLEGKRVEIMVDCGANTSYVSTGLSKEMKRWVSERKTPYPLTLADGSPVSSKDGMVTKELKDVCLRIGNHEETMTIDVTNTKYDIVLGMVWLTKHNPKIDWKRRVLEFPQCKHGTKTGDRSSLKAPPVRAIWVRPQGRMLAGSSIDLPSEYQDFAELFRERIGEAALPEHKPWDHTIPIVEGRTPTHYEGLRRCSQKEKDFMEEYVKKLLAKKFIRQSQSSISHGIVFASKKDGGGLRPCVDYRRLNDITKKNRYPLPRIDELQDRLLGARVFSKLDVLEAFNRVRMAEGEEWKTAFKTQWGLYEYLVMPFGLHGAPATFQALINNTLREYLDNFAIAYLDDILIFSKSKEEHVQHVRKVLAKLRTADLPVKLSKCEFHRDSISFLGYIVSSQGLSPDPEKVKALQDWPEPRTVKDVQSFLGLLNYYRKFIAGFSNIAAPMTALTKKEAPFGFGQECRAAFKELKHRMVTAPILAIFNPEKEAVLETDASERAIGATITQKGEDGRIRPVAYYSRKMTEPEMNYDIHDKELLAVVEAFKTWRVYLEGAKFPVQVYTDHKNLLYWTTTKELNRRQVRWSETLAPYDFKINHVRGTENGRADALSRRPDYGQGMDTTPMSILQRVGKVLTYHRPKVMMFAAMNIELTQEQRLSVIKERHDEKTAGHPGIAKTIELVTRDFTWTGLRNDVTKYVQECDTCAKAKHARHKPYGELQSPAMPDKAWASVALDFITKLPKSKDPLTGVEYDSILVTNDRLTKYTYLEPYLEASNAEALAYTFIRTIIARHGVPEELISDRDKLFTSQFWKSLMDQLGVEHKLSTAYHPQTDGQTERTNQTIEQYLRCYVNHQQDNWVQLLPMAQFSFNNTTSRLGLSPFYANHGYHPNLDRQKRGLVPIAEKANITVEKLKKLHQMMQSELQFIAEQAAKFANKKRSKGPDLREGDMVYLLRRNIKTKRPSNKLDHTKLGPYRIEKKQGPVTYRLKMPKEMRIHPVFHISLLEPAPRNARPGPVEIDEETQEPRYEVEKVCGYKTIGNKRHYLIHWKGYQSSEDTWEPEEHLTKETIAKYQASKTDQH
jgi:hypothetical protein